MEEWLNEKVVSKVVNMEELRNELLLYYLYIFVFSIISPISFTIKILINY